MTDEVPKFTKNEYRQIKYLAYFALFIIFFQAFQYLTTKKTTQKYKALFSKITELVILTNSISFESSAVHRLTLNLNFSPDSVNQKKINNEIANSRQKIKTNFSLIEKSVLSYDLYSFEKTKLFVAFKKSGDEYEANSKKYLLLIREKEKASEFRKYKLRPVLEELQKNQNLFIIQIFTDEQILTDKIAVSAEDTSFILLITGNFLLLLVILFLVYILFSERRKLL